MTRLQRWFSNSIQYTDLKLPGKKLKAQVEVLACLLFKFGDLHL